MSTKFNEPKKCMIDRRKFVKELMSGFAIAVSSASMLNAAIYEKLASLDQRYPRNAAPDGVYWDYVAKQFMFEPGLIMMNNGTAGAMPRVVYNTIVEFFRIQAANPYKCYATFRPYHEDTRQKVAHFINASPDEIALVRNTTEGLNIVIHGLDLKSDDEVLLSDIEHPSGIWPLRLRQKRFGLKIKEVNLNSPPKNKEEILNAFNDAITPRTRLILISHTVYKTGLIAPLKELVQLARGKNVLILADGAHAIGMLDLDMQDIGVDFYINSAYKWLGAPTGTGILYVRKEVQDDLWPNIVGWNWEEMVGARKLDCLGRIADPLIIALGEAIRFQSNIGKKRIERRIKTLATYLKEKASEISGVKLLTSMDPYLSAGLTVLIPNGIKVDHLTNYLLEKYNLVIAPIDRKKNAARICTHIWISFKEIDIFLQGLNELMPKK